VILRANRDEPRVNEEKTWSVLFLCTGNSARSILAESLLRHFGGDRFRAFSAGSEPAGAVQPLALQQIRNVGLPDTGLRSKSVDEFLGEDAPPIDIVITVCDNAAENCPVFPGRPITAHWGMPDPAAVEGTEEERAQAYRNARAELDRRVKLLTNLPLASLDRLSSEQQVRAIGKDRQPA
jgi:arsenate reductase